jgi:hypothetical protein
VQDDRPPDLDETAKALVNTKIIESTDKVSGCATKVPFSAFVGRALSHHPKRMPNSRQRHHGRQTIRTPHHNTFYVTLRLSCVQEVKLYAAKALADILRVYAPDAPYSSVVLLVRIHAILHHEIDIRNKRAVEYVHIYTQAFISGAAITVPQSSLHS